MEVHNQLGPGFLEAVYQEALAIELRLRGVPFRRETETPIEYKGERLSCPYRADFVCYDSLLVELKAMKVLTAIEHAQVINYSEPPHSAEPSSSTSALLALISNGLC